MDRPDSYEKTWKEREFYEECQKAQEEVVARTEYAFSRSLLDFDLWWNIQKTKSWRPKGE